MDGNGLYGLYGLYGHKGLKGQKLRSGLMRVHSVHHVHHVHGVHETPLANRRSLASQLSASTQSTVVTDRIQLTEETV
jgi:hypothetical protein